MVWVEVMKSWEAAQWSYAAQAFAYSTAVLFLFIFIIWARLRTVAAARPAAENGRIVSYIVLAAFALGPAMFGEHSRNPNELLEQGMSRENLAEACVAAVAAAWAIWLLATRAVNTSTFITGVNFWIAMIIALYALSTAWSLWPSMTMFRTIELGAFWIVTIHLFCGRPPLARLTWCLMAAAALGVFCGAVFGWPDYRPSQLFGRYISNQNGMFAGVLVLLTTYRLLVRKDVRSLLLLVISLISFVLFGSLASTIAFLLALLTLLLLRGGRRAGSVAQLLIVAYVLPLVAISGYEIVRANPGAAAWIASMSGKSTELIENATGRLPLWEGIWEINKDNFLGFGFGAAERLLYQYAPPLMGFDPGNAHNGFLSAWVSAGWMAAWAVGCLFLGAAFEAAKRSSHDRALMLPIIVFLAVNNFAYPVVGSYFNSGWFVMIALTCAGPIAWARAVAVNPHYSPELRRTRYFALRH